MQEFEDLVRQFERFQEGVRVVEDPGDRYAGMGPEIAALEASASSPDRSVTVVAGPNGAVKAILFTERAMALGPEALGATALGVLQQAVAAAARQQAEIVQRYVGDDLPVLEQVLQTQAEVFGTTVDQLRSEPHQDDAPRRNDPEDGGDRPVLRGDQW